MYSANLQIFFISANFPAQNSRRRSLTEVPEAPDVPDVPEPSLERLLSEAPAARPLAGARLAPWQLSPPRKQLRHRLAASAASPSPPRPARPPPRSLGPGNPGASGASGKPPESLRSASPAGKIPSAKLLITSQITPSLANFNTPPLAHGAKIAYLCTHKSHREVEQW